MAEYAASVADSGCEPSMMFTKRLSSMPWPRCAGAAFSLRFSAGRSAAAAAANATPAGAPPPLVAGDPIDHAALPR